MTLRETIVVIPHDHPAFAGHFPENPVVPGVVLLDEALHAIRPDSSSENATCRIGAAKFLRPVRPGETLVIRHETAADGTVRFDIMAGAERVATGSVRFDEGAAP